MQEILKQSKPKVQPVLDPHFLPPVLFNRAFRNAVRASGSAVPLGIAIERDQGRVTRFDTEIFSPGHPLAAANYTYLERLLKFLIWQRGGWKISIAGPEELVRFLAYCYSPLGPRAFDHQLWSEAVYQKPFTVLGVAAADLPQANEGVGSELKLDWQGWRIGFDLGASDRKVAVVKDGKLALDAAGNPVLSEEYVWDPRPQTDPQWHYEKIMEILENARQAIRKIDPAAEIQAIGGSSAGIYVNNRVRTASLFRGVQPRERFEKEAAPIFENIINAWNNIPFRLENDGDVTALAGAITLQDGAVLGLAMGSSLAAGYVDEGKQIAGWMNELAFAPVDLNPQAVTDEWSGDRGVGANYFSQQAVARLIPLAGIEIKDIAESAFPERLKRVQELLANGDERARRIYETIGCEFGYTIANYCEFYTPVRHVEVLGRVMTGEGGRIILEKAREVLKIEFPELAQIDFYEPDEREKRHGQAAAAASLPLV